MKIELTITELLIIHQALKDDRLRNTYPHGHMDSSRESAIMKSGKAIEEMDDYLGEAREMRAKRRTRNRVLPWRLVYPLV